MKHMCRKLIGVLLVYALLMSGALCEAPDEAVPEIEEYDLFTQDMLDAPEPAPVIDARPEPAEVYPEAGVAEPEAVVVPENIPAANATELSGYLGGRLPDTVAALHLSIYDTWNSDVGFGDFYWLKENDGFGQVMAATCETYSWTTDWISISTGAPYSLFGYTPKTDIQGLRRQLISDGWKVISGNETFYNDGFSFTRNGMYMAMEGDWDDNGEYYVILHGFTNRGYEQGWAHPGEKPLDSDGPKATAVSFPVATIEARVGQTFGLTPLFTPADAARKAKWSSSSKKVATVTNRGLVHTVGEGKAKITITTASKKKATLILMVVDPDKPLEVSFPQGKSVIMNLGDTLSLQPTLIPATARTIYSWKSSKKKVAAVDENGIVSALSTGKAKITVTTSNKKKAVLTVEVIDPYKPTGIIINQDKEITLRVGESRQLSCTLQPVEGRSLLTWKSSKKKVVSVSESGEIVALKKGKASITVSTYNKKKAKIVVHVVD